MHKFGYYYIPKGRELCVNIARYVNKSRYSNASMPNITEPVIDNDLFYSNSDNLPVKLIPEISHVQLSRAFQKINKLRCIWVYDYGVIVKGSPFTKNADASESIGLTRTSIVVQRYLDTCKLYKNRYSFKTRPNSSIK